MVNVLIKPFYYFMTNLPVTKKKKTHLFIFFTLVHSCSIIGKHILLFLRKPWFKNKTNQIIGKMSNSWFLLVELMIFIVKSSIFIRPIKGQVPSWTNQSNQVFKTMTKTFIFKFSSSHYLCVYIYIYIRYIYRIGFKLH